MEYVCDLSMQEYEVSANVEAVGVLSGPEGFDPSTSGLEGKRSIQTELRAQLSVSEDSLYGFLA